MNNLMRAGVDMQKWGQLSKMSNNWTNIFVGDLVSTIPDYYLAAVLIEILNLNSE